ncbi:hypothetical protein [Marinobacter sp.]|uniref:hypothetical protein n=1 Tax=Marinobacter sp. TaxID=50741 RepID=UPI0035C6E6F5
MKKRITPIEALWYGLAFVVLIAIVAPSANAKIGQPDECALTAIAALKVAQMGKAKASNYIEVYFIKLSGYLWYHARGDEGRFLGWYREACEMRRAPRFIRVHGDRVVKGQGA